MILVCPYCSVEFIKSNKHRKYCSSDHERKYNNSKQDKNKKRKSDRKYGAVSIQSMSDSYIRKVIWHDSSGMIKGVDITPEMIISRRNKLVDSRKIKKERKEEVAKIGPNCRVWFTECRLCGGVFTAKNKSQKLHAECQYEFFLRSKRDEYWETRETPKPFKCKECGKIVIPKYGNRYLKSFCSKKCSGKYYRRLSRHAKEKAELYGVEYEPIDPFKVFKRDQWHCQICGKATPKKNRGTYYTNAPELDHRIPISKGGDHLYSNVQCVCRKCNGLKSNNNSIGQTPLFEVRKAA